MVQNTILDANFWHRCENFDYMVEPILHALRVFDNSTPAMGRAWLVMNNLKNHIFSLRLPPFSLPPIVATKLEEQFVARWDKLKTDLHYAGALLNPFLATNNEIQGDGDAKRALNRVVRRMCGPLGVTFEDVMRELTQYEERRGPYSPEECVDIRVSGLLPHQWWNRIGGQALPIIAKRVLALTCSASSCERNWSMYSFVHSKSRNRLGVQKAEALVYIYANSKLLRERARPDPVRWYDENMHSEDSDPDGEEGLDNDDDVPDPNDGWENYGPAYVNWAQGDTGHGGGNNVEHRNDGVEYVQEQPLEAHDLHQNEAHERDRNIHGDPVNPVDPFEYPWEDNEPHNLDANVVARMPHAHEEAEVDEEEDEQNGGYDRADEGPDDIDSIHNRSTSDGSDDNDDGNGVVEGVQTRQNNGDDVDEGERHCRGENDDNSNRNPRNVTNECPSEHVDTVLHKRGVEQQHAIETSFNTTNCGPSATLDVDFDENIPIGKMFNDRTGSVPRSVGRVIIGSRTPFDPSSNRPPLHRGSTAEGSMLSPRLSTPIALGRTSDERGPGVNRVVLGPPPPTLRGSGCTVVGRGQGSTNGRPLGQSTTPPEIRPFFTGASNTPSPSTIIGSRKVSVDGITDRSKRRRMKRLVMTNTDDALSLEVRNVNSELEEYIPPLTIAAEEMAEGDDEQDDDDSDCNEAPCDDTVVVRGSVERASGDCRRSKRRKAHASGN